MLLGGAAAERSNSTSKERWLRGHRRAAKTRGFHTQLDEGPETP